jgi:hypothetical protein
VRHSFTFIAALKITVVGVQAHFEV